jgi:hypothetical protein
MIIYSIIDMFMEVIKYFILMRDVKIHMDKKEI